MSIPLPHVIHHHHLGGLSSGGGGGDDDDPFRNRPLKSTHELDPTPAISADPDGGRDQDQEPDPTSSSTVPSQPSEKRRRRVPDGPLRCAVCQRSFKSAKALHGHMRCHPERNWRGVVPPRKESGSEKEAAASLVMLSESEVKTKAKAETEEEGRGRELFRCELCKTGFKTRQALGGHRASHKSKKGCYMKGKEKEGVKDKNVAAPSTTAKRRRFEVDLNLPPPPDEEEEGKEKEKEEEKEKNRSQT